jgi:2-oxoglutarate dehydrogenase E2 component (dihydrolipoamide succinyltransferase)
MSIEVKIPEVGEAVKEAVLAEWYKRDGDRVAKDEILFVIETDKVTLEVSAQADGILRIKVPEGQTVAVGSVVAVIETEAALPRGDEAAPREERKAGKMAEEWEVSRKAAPAAASPAEKVKPLAVEEAGAEELEWPEASAPPSVRRLAEENWVDVSKIRGTGPGGRVTRGDVLEYVEKTSEMAKPARKVAGLVRPVEEAPIERVEKEKPAAAQVRVEAAGEAPCARPSGLTGEEKTVRKPMSPIRKRIAERLLEAKQGTAMLTTFNEIDMSGVQAVRAKFKESFRAKYGVSLGIMSFFIKAAVEALMEYPQVNAFIDGKDIVYHEYYHVGVAVGAERGLVVPVIRHADKLSFADLERAIVDFVKKIGEKRLELADLEGGTFTISNGGIYGSLLSTPILNMPQSGILGMHKIEDRPVVVDGVIVIRSMMYVAFSYDHRIIDGREAVGFLKRIKECIENPERIMLEI